MTVYLKYCQLKEPPHPCDEPPVCDPHEVEQGQCPSPFICLERLKNPAIGDEITKCKSGAFIGVKSCKISEPEHPCDPLPPCSAKGSKRDCPEPVLCYHRVKNPEIPKRPLTSDCDPTK